MPAWSLHPLTTSATVARRFEKCRLAPPPSRQTADSRHCRALQESRLLRFAWMASSRACQPSAINVHQRHQGRGAHRHDDARRDGPALLVSRTSERPSKALAHARIGRGAIATLPRSRVLLCIVSNTLCYATTGRPEWLAVYPRRLSAEGTQRAHLSAHGHIFGLMRAYGGEGNNLPRCRGFGTISRLFWLGRNWPNHHGKEGVSGSSPELGSKKTPRKSAFFFSERFH